MSKLLRAGPWGAAAVVLLLASGPLLAGGPGYLFGGSCKCPPPFKWHSEQGPKICFKCACPRPVCDPCSLEHFGYYATCWMPWPYPPDWSHCPCPPPGAVLPPPPYPPYTPRTPVEPRRPSDREAELPPPALRRTAAQRPVVAPAPAPVPVSRPVTPVYQPGVRLVQ